MSFVWFLKQLSWIKDKVLHFTSIFELFNSVIFHMSNLYTLRRCLRDVNSNDNWHLIVGIEI